MRGQACRRPERTSRALLGAAIVAVILVAVALTAVATASAQDTRAAEPIDLPEIVRRANDADRELREAEAALTAEQGGVAVEARLPETIREIDEQLRIANELFASHPTLDAIREVEKQWLDSGSRLAAMQEELSVQADLDSVRLERLTELEASWTRTVETGAQAGVPMEALARAESIAVRLGEVRARTEGARQRVLALQGQVADQQSRVQDALASARLLRETALGRLLARDSDAIWALSSGNVAESGSEARSALVDEVSTLSEYGRRSAERFALHFGVVVLFAFSAAWARRRVRPWVADKPSLAPVAAVFDHPFAMAIVLSMPASGWIHPQAPRIFGSMLGAVALASTCVVLWSLVEASLRPLLLALAGLYVAGVAESIVHTVALASRAAVLAESAAAVVFLVWFARRESTGKWMRRGVAVAGMAFSIAIVSSALGYTTLSRFVVAGCLGSATAAVILYALARILDGLVLFALRVSPLAMLRMTRDHRPTMRRRIAVVVRLALGFVWLLVTLELFAARETVESAVRGALTSSASIGAIRISLGDVLLFATCIVAAVFVARFLLFALEEDVYPRAQLPRGVPFAISTIGRYAVLFFGFVFAVSAMGVDLSKFALLAGAFGIGLGLGLQNVVANFASGLILLFERPVKVGDTVEVDKYAGDLRHIGLRASVIRTLEGSEVIVPNTDLVSEKVINWTLTDQQRRLAIDVGVAYGTEPERVLDLLTEVARAHPMVLDDPRPQALFLGFGDSALNFQLRAWTAHFNGWQVVRSDLAIGINAALRDARIQIPFPQRDLRLVSIPNVAINPTSMAAVPSEEDPSRNDPG
jgi:potassium efflux system protein